MVRVAPLLLLLLACACRPANPPVGDAARADDLGRPVVLPENPRRVIPLAPNLTELLVAAGAAARLAAVSPADDYPPLVDTLRRVGTHPLDLERVLTLEPDLILANTAINDPSDADRLAGLGIPTFYFAFNQLADIPRVLRELGNIIPDAGAAEDAASLFESRIEALRQRAAVREDRPRTLLLIGDRVLYAFGAASYTQELIALAGGESLTRSFRGEGVTLSEEFVLDARPEVIIGAWGDAYVASTLLTHWPNWRHLPAVQNGHVYSIDPDLILRPGPRLADGAEAIAAMIDRAAGMATGEQLP